MTKDEVYAKCLNSKNGVILQEKNFKKNFPDIYEEVNDFCKTDIPFIQKLYNYFNGMKNIPLTFCGKEKQFRNFRHGYNDFCSSNCDCMIKHGNEKRIETSMKKYGVSNPMQKKDISRKTSETKLNYSDEKKQEIARKKRVALKEHYGDNYKTIIEERFMNKYGVKNPSQIPGVAEKAKQSNISRHGGVGFASNEIREKINSKKETLYGDKNYNNSDSRAITCLNKYGKEYYFQTDEFKNKYKNTCFKKYGVDNVSKSDTVKQLISERHKQIRSKKTIEAYPDILEVRENSFIVKCDDNCTCGGKFEIEKHLYFQRRKYGSEICTYKNPIRNKFELEKSLIDYIHKIYDGEVIIHNRKILSGKEIDIYLPELNIGFEFNGDYWHANPMFSKMNDITENIGKHYDKWVYDMQKEYDANKCGISLYTIWEWEWKNNREYIEGYIKNIIDSNIHELSAYTILREFIDSLKVFKEREFGIFESEHVVIRYANAFYCNRKSIDNSWFLDDSEKRVIYVYDFEITDNRKFEIIKSLILHSIGFTKNKIFARKCELREITNKEAKPFLIENSLFGHRNATTALGLFYNGELVMVYSFGYNFYGRSKHIEVIRVCTKKNTVIVGGSSKCLKHFVNNNKKDIKRFGLIFYVDKIHQNGVSLKDFRFVHHEKGYMNYWNIDYNDGEMSGKRHTAFNRMPSKHKKIKELEESNIITSILTIGIDKYEYIYKDL